MRAVKDVLLLIAYCMHMAQSASAQMLGSSDLKKANLAKGAHCTSSTSCNFLASASHLLCDCDSPISQPCKVARTNNAEDSGKPEQHEHNPNRPTNCAAQAAINGPKIGHSLLACRMLRMHTMDPMQCGQISQMHAISKWLQACNLKHAARRPHSRSC